MEMSWIPMVGYGAVGLLVLGWLSVSFMAPGARRTIVEWSSATAMFGALLALFANLLGRALESGNGVAVGAFGFLCLLFGCSLTVSLCQTAMSVGGSGKKQVSATN